MSNTELFARIICLERSLKKQNYRLFLLEKNKEMAKEAKQFIEGKRKALPIVQLDMFEHAVGGL